MAKKRSETPPLMSSAGIIRYFEEEKTEARIKPQSVVVFGLATALLVMILNAYYGLWP
ncbi:MAG TPA: preprotein translocase subunit Sec61beta [Archaeoglobus profundus]|nr:preprotein translocase subunit Sec61beta [Archaeoglobus profundus]